mgnify:CR=1 FL=1
MRIIAAQRARRDRLRASAHCWPAGLLVGFAVGAAAPDRRDSASWHGTTSATRQPGAGRRRNHVRMARPVEPRRRIAPPDLFEPGPHAARSASSSARRTGEGYAVNVLSASRRRDRIVIVFEERIAARRHDGAAQRPAPRARCRSAARSAGRSGLAAPAAGFAAPGARGSSLAAASRPARRGQPDIALGDRADQPRRPAALCRAAPVPLKHIPSRSSVGVPRHSLGLERSSDS